MVPRVSPYYWRRHDSWQQGQDAERPWCEHEAERASWKWDEVTLWKPTSRDVSSLGRPSPQTTPQTGDQIFKHLSLCGMLLIQITHNTRQGTPEYLPRRNITIHWRYTYRNITHNGSEWEQLSNFGQWARRKVQAMEIIQQCKVINSWIMLQGGWAEKIEY